MQQLLPQKDNECFVVEMQTFKEDGTPSQKLEICSE